MTEQEIMQLARNVGMAVREVGVSFTVVANGEEMQRFATLVAEREREACANVCENTTQEYEPYTGNPYRLNYTCAAAIRARGEKGSVQ